MKGKWGDSWLSSRNEGKDELILVLEFSTESKSNKNNHWHDHNNRNNNWDDPQ